MDVVKGSRLEEIIPKLLPSILLAIAIPKTDTLLFSMKNTIVVKLLKRFCSIHIMTVFALGVPLLVNVLELNMNFGLQANFLCTW